MEAIGNSQRARQRRAVLRVLISVVGLVAIFVLLYLIGHLPMD